MHHRCRKTSRCWINLPLAPKRTKSMSVQELKTLRDVVRFCIASGQQCEKPCASWQSSKYSNLLLHGKSYIQATLGHTPRPCASSEAGTGRHLGQPQPTAPTPTQQSVTLARDQMDPVIGFQKAVPERLTHLRHSRYYQIHVVLRWSVCCLPRFANSRWNSGLSVSFLVQISRIQLRKHYTVRQLSTEPVRPLPLQMPQHAARQSSKTALNDLKLRSLAHRAAHARTACRHEPLGEPLGGPLDPRAAALPRSSEPWRPKNSNQTLSFLDAGVYTILQGERS